MLLLKIKLVYLTLREFRSIDTKKEVRLPGFNLALPSLAIAGQKLHFPKLQFPYMWIRSVIYQALEEERQSRIGTWVVTVKPYSVPRTGLDFLTLSFGKLRS